MWLIDECESYQKGTVDEWFHRNVVVMIRVVSENNMCTYIDEHILPVLISQDVICLMCLCNVRKDTYHKTLLVKQM